MLVSQSIDLARSVLLRNLVSLVSPAIPGAQFPVKFQAGKTKPGTSPTSRSISGTGYRILDTGYRIQNTGYRIQDTGYKIQDTTYKIQNIE